MRQDTDILVVGGGVAGLVATVAFASAGYSVICVDPVPPVTTQADPDADLRTTAYLQPARDFLDRVGLWSHVEAEAQGLRTMRIVDLGNDAAAPKDFVSDEISDRPFGWNVANWRMRGALMARLEELPNADFRPGAALARLLPRTHEAIATLSDGASVRARLVVAADGRDSAVRDILGIGAKRKTFGQSALTFAVTHDQPHANVSTEVHLSGGPFTLVPLPDFDSRPCSAVVWMHTDAEIARLKALDEGVFNATATERSGHVMGDLTLVSRRTSWPIISQLASDLIGPRVALVAEAAHVMPPIGAQGLNMSLKDIETLLDLARNADDPGDEAVLRRYKQRRLPDMALRIAGITALNSASMAGQGPFKAARAAGLNILHGVAPIRRGLMRLGLGARG